MARALCVISGIYSGSAKSELLVPVPWSGDDGKVTYTSRGPAGPNGSGPYFKAESCATTAHTAGGTFKTLGPHWGDYTQEDYREYHACASSIGEGPCLWASGYHRYQTFLGSIWRKTVERFYTDSKGNLCIEYKIAQRNFGFRQRVISNDPAEWLRVAKTLPDSECSVSRESAVIKYASGALGYGVKEVISYSGGEFSFKNNELDTFVWAAEYNILKNGSAARFANAYSDAVQNLSLSDVNTLANIMESADALVSLASMLRAVFKKDFGKLIRAIKDSLDPRDLWLKYRYAYLTSKSDVESYKKTLQRLGDLASLGQTITSTGFFSDETGSYKVEIKVDTSTIIPTDTVSFLTAIGVEPNAQNLWDLIPYSFIVDWFLHISDLLEWCDNWGSAINLEVKGCWFTYMSGYDSQHVFYRVSGRRPDIPPMYVTRHASAKTIKMRVADTLSLLR